MTTPLSDLQRRILVEMVSLIRDRKSDPDEWTVTDIATGELFERCSSFWQLRPDESYEIQRRNMRQAFGRALHRLEARELIAAFALGWVNVRDHELIAWQGGGRRRRYPDGYRERTPRFALVSPTREGLRLALSLAGDAA